MNTGTASINEILGRPSVHPFPARMAPCIVLDALAKLPQSSVVLDPMSGSGTVLAIARSQGHRAIGFDIDPLAALISRVWTQSIDEADTRQKARHVLIRAKRIAENLRTRDAYPQGADKESKAFIRFWFDQLARRQLAALAIAINRIHNRVVRETLWCAFSRQIIVKQSGVSLAMDLSHSRPHKVFDHAPRKPFEIFLDCVERVIKGCITKGMNSKGPVANIRVGDGRRLPVQNGSVDLIFTSPPYLNAIDYLRCSKFSLVWMGYKISKLRSIRNSSIGTEVGESSANHNDILRRIRLRPMLPPRVIHILNRYVCDTEQVLGEISRTLAKKGKVVYVVGENTIRGTYVPTGRLVSMLAERSGLQLQGKIVRPLPMGRRYLPPPSVGGNPMDGRMRREVILTFEKQ